MYIKRKPLSKRSDRGKARAELGRLHLAKDGSRRGMNQYGSRNPTWTGGMVWMRCVMCNKKFLIHNSHRARRKCCGWDCSRKYKSRQYMLGLIDNNRIGNKNPNWNGGVYYTKEGYKRSWVGKRKRVFEHRLVMEKHLGRKLEKWEKVHHINGVKDDNRIENLAVVNLKNHFGKISCPHCQKEFLIK